jgi:hypothetical protein
MFSLLYDLSRRSRWLAVIAPHKKPEVSPRCDLSKFDAFLWLADATSIVVVYRGTDQGRLGVYEVEFRIVDEYAGFWDGD